MRISRRLDGYIKLVRLNQPVGLWLLVWPMLWALWLAARGTPPVDVLVVFVLGGALVRSAHYAVVGRTAGPGAEAGRIPFWQSMVLSAVLWLCALILVGRLNRLALGLFALAVLLVLGILVRRSFFGLSRSLLGIAFVFSIPMAYAAVRDSIPWAEAGVLMLASLCWVLAYNTQSVAGAPRHALFGSSELPSPPEPNSGRIAAGWQVAALLFLAIAGVQAERGPAYALGLLIATGFTLYQWRLTRGLSRQGFIKAFLSNHGIGAAIFLGIVWDYGITGWSVTNAYNENSMGPSAMLADMACTAADDNLLKQAHVRNYGFCARRDVTYYVPPDWPHPMQLDVFTPQRSGISPIIVLFHGGHWQVGRRHEMEPIATFLARRGYVAVTASYRLAPAARFPAQLLDAEAAVRWVMANAAQLHGDPKRIGLWGFSAGAHLSTLMATLEPGDAWAAPDLHIRAVVGGGTPTDLEHFNPADGMALFGEPASADPALYHRASPLYHVSKRAPPIFLYHGEDDSEVPLKQATDFRDALVAAGAPVQLYVIRGVGHAGATEAAMDSALGFLDQTFSP